MVRETSAAAYHEIVESGLLSKRRLQVYEYLYRNGPCTARQVSEGVPGGWKRLGELRDLGVVAEIGQTVCGVTAKTVILWDVTSDLPKEARLNTTGPQPDNVQRTLW